MNRKITDNLVVPDYRIMLIWSSADWSIYDVSNGYHNAIRHMGLPLKDFKLNNRIGFWSESLNHWADVSGLPDDKRPDVRSILREACDWSLIEAARFRPDIVVITCAMGFHPDALLLLRSCGFRTALVLSESPYDDEQHEYLAPMADFVFTNELMSTARLAKFNPRTFYLPTAFDASVHHDGALYTYTHNKENAPLEHPNCDVLFVGTGFGERERFLTSLPWSDMGIDFQLYGFWGWAGTDIDPQASLNQDLPSAQHTENHKLLPYIHEPITNDETAARYCGAKIVLNFYRSGSQYSLNPRAYEIAACGAFQLAQDSSDEAHALFGDSIAYFSTPEELQEKIHYYLDHPEEREAMAKESQRRVHNHHSYSHRLRHMLKILAMNGLKRLDEPEEQETSEEPEADPDLPVSLPSGQVLDYRAPSLYPDARTVDQ